jgi:hypothetical protein
MDVLGYVAGGVSAMCLVIIFAMSGRGGRRLLGAVLLAVTVVAVACALYVVGALATVAS